MSEDAGVKTQHPAYVEASVWWKRCRDLVEGSDKVKAGDYLPHPAGMDETDFAFYKQRAQYYNAMARTISALSGAVFRREATVEAPKAAEDQLKDLTLRDEPLDVVSQRVVTELLTVGRYAILLDMPAVEEGKPVPENARPYWVTLPAERVINWRTARVGADPEQLVMVVIREDAPAEGSGGFSHAMEERYRELALLDGFYQSRVWTKAKDTSVDSERFVPGPWIKPMRRGAPLTFIPFTFVGTDGITPDVTRPPLLDLADVSIGHFRNSADLEHGLFLVALPTPWASGVKGDGALRIGPSVVWRLTENGKAGILEISGEGLAAIKDAMAAKERLMATLGARLLEEPHGAQAETATAVRMRQSGESASLRTTAGAASAAITRVLRWHVWWFTGAGDLDLDVMVELCSEYFQVKATPEEVKAALLALQAGEISFATFYSILEKGGWAREGVTAEDERKEIEREKPMREPPPVDDLPPDHNNPESRQPPPSPPAPPQPPREQ
jgi:hypothetical protein